MKRGVDAEELLKMIAEEEIVIYGTGHIAKKLLKVLKQHDLKKNISCFVISTINKEAESEIEGIAIRDKEWLRRHKDIFVCIAVHESLKEEIVRIVRNMGIERYIWIYPYLYELLLGAPLQKKATVQMTDILKTCQNDYRLAIRYAAIDNYFEKNTVGFELYKKAQALHCSPETARERLKKFCMLIKEWEKRGYDGRSIFINTKYEIIDGNHRVALAVYYHCHEIICDIFSGNVSVSEIHGEEAMLTQKILLAGGFTRNELNILDNINEIIRGGF